MSRPIPNGAITLIGNSQMTCPTAASNCTTARSAAPSSSGSNSNINNDFNMAFVDLDGVSTTTNSTSADLAMPAGSVVLYAKLVWGGRRAAGSDYNQIKWRAPGASAYTTLTATTLTAPNLTGTGCPTRHPST